MRATSGAAGRTLDNLMGTRRGAAVRGVLRKRPSLPSRPRPRFRRITTRLRDGAAREAEASPATAPFIFPKINNDDDTNLLLPGAVTPICCNEHVRVYLLPRPFNRFFFFQFF